MSATQLYRHYDADGNLLYVGVSLNVLKRSMDHKRKAHWFARIARIEVEIFASRDEALIAETAAINAEPKPLFNVQRCSKKSVVTSFGRTKALGCRFAIAGGPEEKIALLRSRGYCLLKPPEVMGLLDVSKNELGDLVEAGKLSCVALTQRTFRFLVQDVLALLETRTATRG